MYPYSAPYRRSEKKTTPKDFEIPELATPKSNITQTPADRQVLEMVCEAIKNEKEEIDYLHRLEKLTVQPTDKEIIHDIALDAVKHVKIFSDIYKKLAGEEPEVKTKEKLISKKPLNEYEKEIFDLLDTVEFYRKIYYAFLNLEVRDMLYDVITDKQAHSTKFTYLYAKNG